MSKLKVYISSTFLDLQELRRDIINRIQSGLHENFELTTIMEKMSGDPHNRPDIDICLAEVRKADVYILLIGNRFGSYPEKYRNHDGTDKLNTECKSYTELEYEAACHTLDKKFYGIYKFEFAENLFSKETYDLDDLDKRKGFDRFARKLKATTSPININLLDNLRQHINDKLTEFYQMWLTKEELNLTQFDIVSINRKEQLRNVIKNFEGGTCVYIIEADDENDCCDEFTTRLQYILYESTDPEFKPPNVNYINSNTLASYTSVNDKEKILERILKETSPNIYKERNPGTDFTIFREDIKRRDPGMYKSVAIGFKLYPNIDINEDVDISDIIISFIKKIETILQDERYGYNYFIIIYLISKVNTQVNSLLNKFTGQRNYKMGRLAEIEADDINEWIEFIKIKRTSIQEEETSYLFNIIFLDKNKFPTKYKKCKELINKRTK